MPQQTCAQCGAQFTGIRSTAKFCGDSCRYKFWLKEHNLSHLQFNTIADIKDTIEQSKEEFKKLHNHFKRVMDMYDEFENMIVKLEDRLIKFESDNPDIVAELQKDNELLEQQIENQKINYIELEQKYKELKKKKSSKPYDALADLIDKE